MNWVIRHNEKIKFHTYLNQILEPILDDIRDYNWLLSDLEYVSHFPVKLPIDLEQEYFILSPSDFNVLLNAEVQIWWGVVLGISKNIAIEIDKDNLPFAEGNELIWKNGNMQYRDAEIEIVAVDSGYTIVKFKDEKVSDKFHAFFPEAIELEIFSKKFL
ncbi:hypothetical protein [uncultured Mucilaginibacter sp.]|uniref:hypothetical protein n=1 Tax=uncultured Mucilaginibacter sp. TaxID=797541 RepID=UPI0025FA074D|nr:hypothetical protein [uncultured Mucilaginibacter sp.]